LCKTVEKSDNIYQIRPTPWHHDQPYYPLNASPTDTISFWIPLDPVISGQNSVEFIAGSHKGPWFIPRKFQTAKGYSLPTGELLQYTDWAEKNYQTLDEDIVTTKVQKGEQKILSWNLQPGDAVAFSFLTLHGAPGNKTDRGRRVISLRFAGDNVTITKRRPWEVSPPIYGSLQEGQELREDPQLFPDMTKYTK